MVKKTRVVESFGRIDKLSEEQIYNLDQMYCKSVSYDLIKLADQYSNIWQKNSDDTEDLNETLSNKDESYLLTLNYGNIVVQNLCKNFLSLEYKLNYLQNTKSRVKAFNFGHIVSFMIASKLINPSSYLHLFDCANSFIANPLNNVSLDSIYKVLGLLCTFKDDIMKHVYKKISKTCDLSKPKLLFFDCTNFYFEAPYDSQEEFTMKHMDRAINDLQNQGKNEEEIKSYIDSEEYSEKLHKDIEQAKNNGLFLRMREPSKECRCAQPITGLSLVIDQNGIPIDFDVYPENQSEYGHLPPAVDAIKEKYNIENAFFIADRGLNSTSNLKYLLDKDKGF